MVVWHILFIPWLTILRLGFDGRVSSVHGRTSHANLVIGAITRIRGTGSHLCISTRSVLVLTATALPKWFTTSTLGIVVLRAGAVSLLCLVITSE